jgi:hypothetical protein
MKFNQNQDYWASCYYTNKFLLIETQSGLGMVAADPLFHAHLLNPDEGDKCIGKTILQALSDSRTLTSPEERVDFFDLQKGEIQYAAWISMLMDRYTYKTKKSLFSNMKHCIIHCSNGVITISPTRHERLEAWEGIGKDGRDKVKLSVESSPEEVGAGLRLALSRCIP